MANELCHGIFDGLRASETRYDDCSAVRGGSTPIDAHRRTGLPLVVTENGAAYDDVTRAADGSVDDQDRVAYLREHIAAVELAREAGADVRTYVAWTLLDNFEWGEGYTKKFGLVEVDRSDQRRTPKSSYRWFSDLVHAGRPGPTS